MKTYTKPLGIAAMTLGMLAWGNAIADVATTPHNLGSGGPGPNTFSGTAEVCVFCHTPHGGDTTAEVPLWNRGLADPATYTTYTTTSSSSVDLGGRRIIKKSIACLSCHDGTQAMDTLLNDPGSGAVVTSFTNGVWTGNDRPQGIADVGQDLSNDHPIGIQYGGGGITSATPTAATNDPDFVAPANQVINGTTVWWVDTEASPDGLRQKTDMQLYTRDESASIPAIAGGPQPFVECASCHDPHSNEATFLRIANTGSAVCLACHNK
jgi:predicted CXXCH cytochrome family protein